ncbi:MAG: DUF2088 domain-containing protein [Lachnospiraceae bacterium]|nr:DUF2088 domain-containing protein [Lachnospiraceae bacterium]
MTIDFPEVHFPIQGLDEVTIPRMVRIRQNYDRKRIEDIPEALSEEFLKRDYEAEVRGKRIAVTVGSRGIPNNVCIVRAICDQLKAWGADPFIVPAMGSHGGGTAAGNLEILSGYGITEENVGVPIRASMDVVQIGELPDGTGTPVYCDRFAAEADGIVVYNKVKLHTDFKGEHESGLLKMMAIGLAKHKGCSALHRRGFDTFAENIPKAAEVFLQKMNVVFAVGVVQNAYDEISELRVYPHDEIIAGDAELLKIARARFPRFRFDDIDVLVIDRIGKDISGEGADPNVTGRGYTPYFEDDFHTRKLFIRGLSENSHRNACGLGLADITTRRCLNSVDWESTWVNLTTNLMIHGGKIPFYQNNDYDALRVALRTCPRIDYQKARIARIRDTLSLFEFEVSEALAEELKDVPGVEILSAPYDLLFDSEGYLEDFT